MKKFFLLLFFGSALLSQAKIQNQARDPYVGAIVVDAATGQVLFADHADDQTYPASVLKLMDLLIILEKIEAGQLHYSDPVKVTAESCGVGGTQVWLKEHEIFSIEEMLYALMIQSANDAAAALAIQIGGSQEGFITLMNEKAQSLGMTNTHFTSVHGLPPRGGAREPDVTTARDLSTLCLELVKHPDTFKFTAVKQRDFRPDGPRIDMINHNHLIGQVEGCDGFKTGFIQASGYSIAATAKRKDRRVICIVLGSLPPLKRRDTKAAELLAKGFLILPEKTQPPVVKNSLPAPVPMPVEETVQVRKGTWASMLGGILIGLGLAGAAWGAVRWRSRAQGDFIRRS